MIYAFIDDNPKYFWVITTSDTQAQQFFFFLQNDVTYKTVWAPALPMMWWEQYLLQHQCGDREFD